jgi:hypothetical protein
MLSNNRSEVSLERYGHTVPAVYADETAAVGVEEMHLGVLAGLIDLVDLEAGRA